MKIFQYIVVFIAISTFFSCEKVFTAPKPQTDNLAIFDEYATLIKEKYAMLEFKGVDIQPLTDSIRATIDGSENEVELFNKLTSITKRLRDSHSPLIASEEDENLFEVFDTYEGYPIGLDILILTTNYLADDVAPNIEILPAKLNDEGSNLKAVYGTLPQDEEIGYIWIPSWLIDMSDDEIDSLFIAVKDTKGLIFDMRGNGGGDPSLATKVASYLMESPTVTGFERFKTGPGLNDFADSPSTVQPSTSEHRYLGKPVAVLTDRGCYSATTTFAYSLNPLDNVTFIGQRTGGGSGSVADGYLSNGWKWGLSTSEFIDHENRHLDDGIDPDIQVTLDTMVKSIDEVVERAILELQ